jgi:hypothetical protein
LFPLYFLLSPFTSAWEIGRRFVKGLSGDGGGSGPAAGQPSSSGGAER